MQPFSAFTVALSFALSVSSLVVPRTNPPAGWNAAILENYDTYHNRYMALSCQTKHNTAFFDQCCHPLLATQSLADRPAQCNPATNSTAAGDDDLPFCDDGDDDDNTAPTTTAVVATATTTAHPTTTTHATTTTAAAAKKVVTTAHPAATTAATNSGSSSTNSGSSSVNTGGFATFFYQNGVAGACGTVHPDTAMIAAIDADRYGNTGVKSPLCGKQVHITNTKNGKSVTVTIADACPTCDNSNSIDLSVSAFEAIGTLDEGLLPIEWNFV